MPKQEITVFWFRRDLRIDDNLGLYRALTSGHPVLPIFIFDKHILDKLEGPVDLRVQFIHQHLHQLHNELKELGSGLKVFYGTPEKCIQSLLNSYTVLKVITNHDYEPYALDRDQQIANLCQSQGVNFETYKDHVIFENKEVCKDDGQA